MDVDALSEYLVHVCPIEVFGNGVKLIFAWSDPDMCDKPYRELSQIKPRNLYIDVESLAWDHQFNWEMENN